MNRQKIPNVGEIRQSQILSTFGPGSMIDLPKDSVIIGGLKHWRFPQIKSEIHEDRLKANICRLLGLAKVKLYSPPSSQDLSNEGVGISVFSFPNWYVAQCDSKFISKSNKEYRTRPLIPKAHLVKNQYLDRLDNKKHPVVPVRFVQACVNGHISDIDWSSFVHRGETLSCSNRLWLDESGSGSNFDDIYVRCEGCKRRRQLKDATNEKMNSLGHCQGHSPWLGYNYQEAECINSKTQKLNNNRLLVRSASNAYFPQNISVISLPDQDEPLRKAVDRIYGLYLEALETQESLPVLRRILKDKLDAIKEFSDEKVWRELQRRKNNPNEIKKIKQTEIETLLASNDLHLKDLPDGDFFARNLDLGTLPNILAGKLERIVLVDRLKEVVAQIGFTRFEPAMPDIDGELILDVALAPLDTDIGWLPAIENKGEGIFISFCAESIDQWLAKDAVKQRSLSLKKGFTLWQKNKGISQDQIKFPGLPYIMLHSLSHLLITNLSLECGYSASAIKERIYAGESGYGILLYTGSAGSEGTLGGLVEQGKKIKEHMISALEIGKLCSNDPVCSLHQPYNQREKRFLHGAACHGCLLIAETSCERHNEYLDRALLVDTFEDLGAAFFSRH